MAKKRTPVFVALSQAVSEIQTITATVRQIVKDAHQLGDLDLRLRRPDGSTDTQLDRNIWNDPLNNQDLLFENGLIDAPARPRRGSIRRSMRRVPPMATAAIGVPNLPQPRA